MISKHSAIGVGLASALYVIATTSVSSAAPLVPVSATASSAAPGYSASLAIDQGPTKLSTDWAANFTGAGSFITFDLGSVQSIDQIIFTDRTTSGGANGTAVYGTGDFTTSYRVQFSNSAAFSTVIATYNSPTLATPVKPSSAVAFQTTVSLSPVAAEYVRYLVLASNGSAPGLADASFDVVATTSNVPEPASLLLLGTALASFGLARRRK